MTQRQTGSAARLEPQTLPEVLVSSTVPRVAFQGERGAFSEEVILSVWGNEAEPISMWSFDDVAHAAEIRKVDYGVLPIESTLVGGVDVAFDLLALNEGLTIVAEVVLPIHLALLGLPGTAVRELRTLSSHPLMLAQCSHFLDRHRHIEPQPAWDTAGAAREVMERGDPSAAAAAGLLAAERFGLQALAPQIEDRPDTMMRFVIVAADPVALPTGSPARTALLCALGNGAGALMRLFEPLARAGINVSTFTSRPTREPWDYQFFLEVEHDVGDDRAASALESVARACTHHRILGTYPRSVLPSSRAPIGR